MSKFWDEKYSSEEYVYGVEPNQFFAQVINDYNLKGSILLPADGEGRNSVYAAKKGLKVTSFDASRRAKEKALKLANLNHVTVEYLVGDIAEMEFEPGSFDVVALIFAHFPPELRYSFHTKLSGYLKKGGLFIIEGFSKKQLEFRKTNPYAGGPNNVDMLLSINEIDNDFHGFRVISLEERVIELGEGNFHKGKSSVIRFLGEKVSDK